MKRSPWDRSDPEPPRPAKIVSGLKSDFSRILETLCKQSALPVLAALTIILMLIEIHHIPLEAPRPEALQKRPQKPIRT